MQQPASSGEVAVRQSPKRPPGKSSSNLASVINPSALTLHGNPPQPANAFYPLTNEANYLLDKDRVDTTSCLSGEWPMSARSFLNTMEHVGRPSTTTSTSPGKIRNIWIY